MHLQDLSKSFIEVKKELSKEQKEMQSNLRRLMQKIPDDDEQVNLYDDCSDGEDPLEFYGLLSCLDLAEEFYYFHNGLKRQLTDRFSRKRGVGRCEDVSKIALYP